MLQVLLRWSTGLLFFTTGFDHQLIRVLAASFENLPGGRMGARTATLDGVVRARRRDVLDRRAAGLPVIALLILIDFALALLGRVQQQLQLLSLAFPVKMLAPLAILAALAPVVPRLFSAAAEHTLAALWR